MKTILLGLMLSLLSVTAYSQGNGVKPVLLLDEGSSINVVAFTPEYRINMMATYTLGNNLLMSNLWDREKLQVQNRLQSLRLATGRMDIETAVVVSAEVKAVPAMIFYRTTAASSVSDTGVTPTVSALGGPTRIVNVSTRANVGTGENVLVAGFVIAGTQPKKVVIRGIGPALGKEPFNIIGAMADPELVLRTADSSQTIVARNDDWDGSAATQSIVRDVGAFAIAPGSKDAVIVVTLPPGGYTVTVSAAQKDQRLGIALIEIYDGSRALGENPNSEFINLSTRLMGIGSAGNSAFAGVVTDGRGTAKLLFRAIGPGLRQFGIVNNMADPVLSIYDGRAIEVARNNNWSSGNVTLASFAQVGAFALAANSLDASTVFQFPVTNPTSYIAGVEGIGVLLVEAYYMVP